MIPARIREAHIEVPVVRRKHMKIGLHQFAATALEAKENGADARRARERYLPPVIAAR